MRIKNFFSAKTEYVKVEDKNRFYYMLQFVGNLNKVVDYWFNSEDRDKMLIQKVDEEDGQTKSDVTEII